MVGATGTYIRLLEGDQLVIRVVAGATEGYLTPQSLNVEEGTSLSGHVMATKKPLHGNAAAQVLNPEARRTRIEQGRDPEAVAAVPLLTNDQPIGTLLITDESQGRRFTEDEVSLLSAFADQAALALEKARLLNEAEREKERAETERERANALYRVSNLLAGAHDTKEVLDLIVNEAARLIGTSTVIIRLLEGDALVFGAATEAGAEYFSAVVDLRPTISVADGGSGVMGRAMVTKTPFVTEDVTQEERVPPETKRIQQEFGYHGSVVVPLLADDRAIGVMALLDTRIRQFTDDEISLLTALADQAALAIEKARLLKVAETERERAETERERADSLYKISNQLAGVHDTDEVLDLIVNEAARLVGATTGVLQLLEGEVLVNSAATKSAPEMLEVSPRAVGTEASFTGHVMATKKPLIAEDGQVHGLMNPDGRLALMNGGYHGLAAIPLLTNNQSIGVFIVMDQRIRRFTDDEVSLLTAFADQAALALEKARLSKQAETERERSDALYQISNQLAGAHNTDEVLDLIVNEAARLVGAPWAFVALVEAGKLAPRASTESAADYLAEIVEAQPTLNVETGTSAMGHMLATRTPHLYEDGQEDELATATGRNLAKKYGLHGGVLVPLLANDLPLGALAVMDKRIRRFTEDEISLLSAFADQASLALEKAWLLSEAETKEHETLQLYEVTTQLASNHDMDSVLDLIPKTAAELLNCDAVMITRYDEAQNRLVVARQHNFPPEMLQSLVIRPGDGRTGRAFQERRPVWTTDARSDPSWKFAEESTDNEARNAVLGGALAVPIVLRRCLWRPHHQSHRSLQLRQSRGTTPSIPS